MTADLSIDVERWLERTAGSDEARATFGELRITVGGVHATTVLDRAAKTTRSTVRVSASHLAEWVCWNLWRLLDEPDRPDRSTDWAMAHHLAAVGHGFQWPPLMLSSDGENVHLAQRPAGGREAMVHFLEHIDAVVPLSAVDDALWAFVDQVTARLTAAGLHDAPLCALAAHVREQHQDPTWRPRRRAEALLGLDPGDIEPEAIDMIRKLLSWVGDRAADEVLATTPYRDVEPTLDWLAKERARSDLVRVDLSAVADHVEPPDMRREPWQRGVDLAGRVRAHLGAGVAPLPFEEVFGVDLRGAPREGPLGAAFATVADPGSVTASLRRGHRRSRRFEAARLVGDALVHRGTDTVLPATDVATARQRFQRAFAQELLCPIDGLRERLTLPRPRDVELEQAADHFGVSEWTVRSALVNRGDVARDYLPG